MQKYRVDIDASLKYQENGRFKPADTKEYAKSKLKKLICPNCGFEKTIDRIVFGENLNCPYCKTIMIKQY